MPICHDYIHTCTYLLTYMHICIHTYMHATYIHVYIHTYAIWELLEPNGYKTRDSSMKLFRN